MKIIGLIGKARSGKSTVADYLQKHYNYQQYAFADPIKDMLELVFGDRFREGNREADIPWLGKSPRQLMQTLGTNWGRDMVHPNLWALLGQQRIAIARQCNEKIVLSDVRFHNEADMILKEGGELWRIIRPEEARVNQHPSEETDWTGYPYKTINNSGSLQKLHLSIEAQLGGDSFDEFVQRLKVFTGSQEIQLCHCDHKLQGTGGVFYQSVKLMQCNNCKGWQNVRKPIE